MPWSRVRFTVRVAFNLKARQLLCSNKAASSRAATLQTVQPPPHLPVRGFFIHTRLAPRGLSQARWPGLRPSATPLRRFVDNSAHSCRMWVIWWLAVAHAADG